MMTVLRAAMLSLVVAGGFVGVARAEGAPAARPEASNEIKKGDTVYVCGCGGGCACGTVKATPGTCHCGGDLVKATVTKVGNGTITVDKGGKGGEQTMKAPYRCGCGKDCPCNTAAFGPGKCHCGKELVKG